MIQYLTTDTGQKTAALVPISEWEDILAKLERLGIKGDSWEEFVTSLQGNVAKDSSQD